MHVANTRPVSSPKASVDDASVAGLDPRPAGAARGRITMDLELRHAGRHRVHVSHEGQGAAAAPVVLVAGGITADRHVASSAGFPDPGWWEPQVGAGRALDPGRHRIVAIDWLGSDGTLDVPIDPLDQANAIAAVLDALGVRELSAFVGCSYGALVGLQFAAAHPRRLRQLVAISGSDRAHPYASAWRALQRRAVALRALQCDEIAGLALARALAMLSYRTPEEFAERFPDRAQVSHGRVRCPAEDYLDACGQRFIERMPPVAFLRLSESIDLHAVDPGAILTPTTVVAVEEDRVFPIAEARRLVARLGGESRLRVLRSQFGHDAFLKEHNAIHGVLVEALHGAPGSTPGHATSLAGVAA